MVTHNQLNLLFLTTLFTKQEVKYYLKHFPHFLLFQLTQSDVCEAALCCQDTVARLWHESGGQDAVGHVRLMFSAASCTDDVSNGIDVNNKSYLIIK